MDEAKIKNNLVDIWKDIGKVQWIPTMGCSMQPLIQEGMEVAVKFCHSKNISIGDIIAFERGSDTVVHRVIGKTKVDKIIVFLEKGDNNPTIARVPEFDCMGKVIALRTKKKDFSIQGPLWKMLDYLFVLYGWCFAYLFLFLYRVKCLFLGKEKTSLSQKIYRLLMEILLCIPRMIARIIKKF